MNMLGFQLNKNRTCGSHRSYSFELTLWASAILLCNMTLPTSHISARLLLTSSALSGEWWRWLTHPFVHVSPYHLVLDASAFLSLYLTLPYRAGSIRLIAVLFCAMGSSLAAVSAGVLTQTAGFCGLSGVAHGLMAVVALDLAANKKGPPFIRQTGCISFVLLSAKSLVEALSGNLVFDFVHPYSVGLPIAVCHAGGTLGGVLAYALFAFRTRLEGNHE
ncbi:MAG TPA: rhombosortase [Verrucomicrobia bacterium]|nr:MAG: rhombosortase [Lentisphaerae bacterium GWF2_57_35]HBA82566.1 rhombosortase [Verrucomicrobiota bacterium]